MLSYLTTDRLILRRCSEADSDKPYELFKTEREAYGFGPDTTLTRERGAMLLRSYTAPEVRNDQGFLAITLKTTGQTIGQAGLRPLILPWKPYATAEVELHCTLEPQHWDKGYAEEACRALIHLAFEEMGLLRLVAIVRPDDQYSQNLLKRLGFTIAPGPDSWVPKLIGVLVNPACSK